MPTFDVLNSDLTEIDRIDFARLSQLVACPILSQPVTIHEFGTGPGMSIPLSSSGKPAYQPGFYYRCPVGTGFIESQPVPKYDSLFVKPYSGILYPPGDTYDGQMLIKNTQIVGSPPGDLIVLTSNQAASEVQRLFNTFFAF